MNLQVQHLRRFAAVVTLFAGLAVMASEPLQFDSAEEQDRFEQITAELRCLVCQNQSLADSDAPLAQDLRNEVYAMMKAGDSDEAIRQFMVDRYGDFVLYRPPIQGNTLLLWLAPGLLLVGGAVFVGFTVRRRTALMSNESDKDPTEMREDGGPAV